MNTYGRLFLAVDCFSIETNQCYENMKQASTLMFSRSYYLVASRFLLLGRFYFIPLELVCLRNSIPIGNTILS